MYNVGENENVRDFYAIFIEVCVGKTQRATMDAFCRSVFVARSLGGCNPKPTTVKTAC